MGSGIVCGFGHPLGVSEDFPHGEGGLLYLNFILGALEAPALCMPRTPVPGWGPGVEEKVVNTFWWNKRMNEHMAGQLDGVH